MNARIPWLRSQRTPAFAKVKLFCPLLMAAWGGAHLYIHVQVKEDFVPKDGPLRIPITISFQRAYHSLGREIGRVDRHAKRVQFSQRDALISSQSCSSPIRSNQGINTDSSTPVISQIARISSGCLAERPSR